MSKRSSPRSEIDTMCVSEMARHVVVHSGTLTLECLHCHDKLTPPLPAPLDDYLSEARAFAFEHAKCRKVIV